MTTPTIHNNRNKFYLATWRWHFYAGVYVIPFMIMLALTGLVMLFHNQIEETQYADRIFVSQGTSTVSATAQVEAVRQAYPDAAIRDYIPPSVADRSAQISIRNEAKENFTVFVNPYTGEILGEVNKAKTWNHIANEIHGNLLMDGPFGDRLIEIAAGLSILLLITGLYLWWPRDKAGRYAMFFPRFGKGKRILWRDLHSSLGFYLSAGLLFFLISGMAWTGVWGGKIVQPWGSFPAEKRAPVSEQTHASLNNGAVEEIPWALELTPLPLSGSMAGAAGIPEGVPVNVDTVMLYARDNGFTGFRVKLPQDETGVYTVSAATMSGDIKDARQDRTIHIDQYTGNKLADVGWQDYNLMAKGMAAGIALHMGEAGSLNFILDAIFCLGVILLSVSGVVMWWLRRPQGARHLAAPPFPKEMPLWRGAVLIMLAVSMAFPLVGLTLVIVLALDMMVLSRMPRLKQIFS